MCCCDAWLSSGGSHACLLLEVFCVGMRDRAWEDLHVPGRKSTDGKSG